MSTIEQLLEEANELTALAADLNDRTVDWRAWNDELTCDDKQEVAAEEAAIAATDAWMRVAMADAEEEAYAEKAQREARRTAAWRHDRYRDPAQAVQARGDRQAARGSPARSAVTRTKRCDEHQKRKCADVRRLRLRTAHPHRLRGPRRRHLPAAGSRRGVVVGAAGRATSTRPCSPPRSQREPEVVRAVLENAPPKFDLDERGSPVGLWIRLTVGGVHPARLRLLPVRPDRRREGAHRRRAAERGDAVRRGAGPVGQGRPGRPDRGERHGVGRSGPPRPEAIGSRGVRQREPRKARAQASGDRARRRCH